MRLPENSLFAILLRSPWWISLLLAFGAFGAARLFLPPGVAAFFALPFAVIGLYAASKQWSKPSAKRIAVTLGRARELPWEDFRAALEEGFRREGYSASRSEGKTEGGADIDLWQDGRVTLVACKRWKAVRTGVEPLREFDAATKERGAHDRMYVATGEVTDSARAFAREKKIRLVGEEDLARLLR